MKLEDLRIGEYYLDMDGDIVAFIKYDSFNKIACFKWQDNQGSWFFHEINLQHTYYINSLKHLPAYSSPLYKALNT